MLMDSLSLVPEGAVAVFESLAQRRLKGEPVAYLLGRKEFYGLDFEVNPDVLIPRPETELMVDHLLATVVRDATLRVLDLGTGSGALAVTCATMFPNVRVTAATSRKGLWPLPDATRESTASRTASPLFALTSLRDLCRRNRHHPGQSSIRAGRLARSDEREVLRHEPWLALLPDMTAWIPTAALLPDLQGECATARWRSAK